MSDMSFWTLSDGGNGIHGLAFLLADDVGINLGDADAGVTQQPPGLALQIRVMDWKIMLYQLQPQQLRRQQL